MRAIRHLLPIITPVHRFVHHTTGGRLGAQIAGFRFLVLEHVGRTSGQARETPLLYVEDEGRFIVAASNAGRDRHPAWWLNLEANPEVAVRIGRTRVLVKARRAIGTEADHLWGVLDASWRWFDEYRRGTDRDIPVVILEPVGR